jgi:hypothetical protein
MLAEQYEHEEKERKFASEYFAPCGGRLVFDRASGCGYLCIDCLCVYGSVGMPQACGEKMEVK